jgi:hypothetical protein
MGIRDFIPVRNEMVPQIIMQHGRYMEGFPL